MKPRLYLLPIFFLAAACGPGTEPAAATQEEPNGPEVITGRFVVAGHLESVYLNEASGIQALTSGDFVLHNDEGTNLFIIDAGGRHRGRIQVLNAKNRDWEDITRIPGSEGPLIVIADSGDNDATHKRARLYFVPEPVPDEQTGNYPATIQSIHRLKLGFPDGPRDVESVAYDPSSGMILLLSKRNKPPRLYGVALEKALAEEKADAVFLAEVPTLRGYTREDLMRNPARGLYVSNPTGMDISPDGRLAAVLTYRSLYVYERAAEEAWAEAFQREPVEYLGPEGLHDEAVTFGLDGRSIYVTTERRPAPLHRLDL